MNKKIVVIGSINMDLVVSCDNIPIGGETVIGKSFEEFPGGKGANQAVALGKLKTEITMLGKIGDDLFGEILLDSMKKNNVITDFIEKDSSTSTGIANIIVESNGQNRIIVIQGANQKVNIDYIDRHINLIKEADYIVTQLEIPKETVAYILKKSKELGKITILNPAPAIKLDDDVIKNCDYLIPNETELEILSGMKTTDVESIKKAAESLLKKGVKNLIVTMGKDGSIFFSDNEKKIFPAFKVKAVDTTAAGDSYIGGFVSGISSGMSVEKSIKRGTCVAAISVTRKGAQSSLPDLEEVINYEKGKII
ncbi:MAG: ribokinase [Fusobacteriaceae bacterium]